MKRGKLISIATIAVVAILVIATTVIATTALAGNNSDMSKEKGGPQQIQLLLKEVGTLQNEVQSQSSQIAGLNTKLTSDEQTISELKSKVSQSNSGPDGTPLEKEVNELMYTPTNLAKALIPNSSRTADGSSMTKEGNTPDGYTIWKENYYYSLENASGLTIPLSNLSTVSVDLTSTTVVEQSLDGGSPITLSYATGMPQKNQFSITPVSNTQFTIEFTTPPNFDQSNGFSLQWDLSNGKLPNLSVQD